MRHRQLKVTTMEEVEADPSILSDVRILQW